MRSGKHEGKKHEPLRTCVACRRVRPARDLVRFALQEGRVVIDDRSALPGRGAWLCPAPDCLDRALRRGGFARAFRRDVRPADRHELWTHLRRVLDSRQTKAPGGQPPEVPGKDAEKHN